MKKNDITLFLACALPAAPAAAQNFDGLPPVAEIVKEARSGGALVPVSQPAQAKPKTAEWTVMVFMNGKNSLSPYVVADMNEMEKYGPAPGMNIVTQAARSPQGGGHNQSSAGGPYPGWPPFMGPSRGASTNWTGVRRYLVARDGDNAELSSTLLADLGSVDMGSSTSLADFGRWAKANYPARHYMLIVWNHGSGWEMRGPVKPAVMRGISFDDETGHSIDPVALGIAVRAMGGVDVYASDACLMQMAEVAYELRNAARVVVGSEENEPGDGWAYDTFLARAHAAQNGLTAELLASAAVQGYKEFYTQKGEDATQSALRTSGLAAFRGLLDQWAVLAMKEKKADIKEALERTVSFGGADSRDLLNFLENVHAKTASAELKAKTAEVWNQFYRDVYIDNGIAGQRFRKAYGLGVYLPRYGFNTDYNRLDWARQGGWDEFVKWLTQVDPPTSFQSGAGQSAPQSHSILPDMVI